VLLVALWVLSHWWQVELRGNIGGRNISISNAAGRMRLSAGYSDYLANWNVYFYQMPRATRNLLMWQNNHIRVLIPNGLAVASSPAGIVVELSLWLALLINATVATIVWLPWWSSRFSLRALLLAMTLAALVLGRFVWAIH